jgi:5-methylcytosine-specific restriction protein A
MLNSRLADLLNADACYIYNPMSINAALTLFLEEYPSASSATFADHPVANFIRLEIPKIIRAAIGNNQRYIVQGSPGQGNWARVPWVAVFDRFVTETAQDGYYLVYLVREDFSGVYLSLNQGVTTVKRQYGADAKEALSIRARDFLARIGNTTGTIDGPIDLRVGQKSRFGPLYEQGAICSIFYERSGIPADEVLLSDLKLFLDYYFKLVSSETSLIDHSNTEEDEANVGWEDLRQLRIHKRLERNRSLATKVKRQLGFTCQACGMNFEEKYGPIGKDYIEAHHLTPIAELHGRRVALDPKKDFAVLCSNCHRMIHKSPFVSDVEMFRHATLDRTTS